MCIDSALVAVSHHRSKESSSAQTIGRVSLDADVVRQLIAPRREPVHPYR